MDDLHVKHVEDRWEVWEDGKCVIQESQDGDMLRALWRLHSNRGRCSISVPDLMELVGGKTALWGYG